MDTSTMGLIGAAVVCVVAFFAFRNRQTAAQIQQGNTGVIPLMQQKATQLKVNRLIEATQGIPDANLQLQGLIASYKNQQISFSEYNVKLDAMIGNLEVEL